MFEKALVSSHSEIIVEHLNVGRESVGRSIIRCHPKMQNGFVMCRYKSYSFYMMVGFHGRINAFMFWLLVQFDLDFVDSMWVHQHNKYNKM